MALEEADDREMDTAGGPIVVGVDLGATLSKVAIVRGDGAPEFESHPTGDVARVARRLDQLAPSRVGLTGGGAASFARGLRLPATQVQEFDAWGAGVRKMAAAHFPQSERYLLVSLGTGTSILLVAGDQVLRVGGTALGGGTIVGLGQALVQTADFDELTDLASRGDRSRVDLLVKDIYQEGELPLPGDLNAASFGKLARKQESSREDRAAGLMGLVGENVVLICSGLAAACNVSRVVYCGSTLRDNPALVKVIADLTVAVGRQPLCLAQGEFGAALGALETARSAAA